jgi:hypothetical protein
MSYFTVRVELHDARRADYNALHAAMAQKGFSRSLTSDDGRTYELPWAEFDCFAKLTAIQILGIVQEAASIAGDRNSILVTEVKSRAWSGLPVATVDAYTVPHFEETLPATVEEGSSADDWA